MKRVAVALLAVMMMTERVSGQGLGGFEYYGITHVSWWFDEYGYPGATSSRDELAATNANWAGVLLTWYQPTVSSNAIAPSGTKTPTDAAIRKVIAELHAKGMKVMLKPHVDTNDGGWRGSISPSDRDAWFASYTEFIVKYARMAADEGVEMLCVGTELKAVSGSANRERWYRVIDAVRAVYSGTVTYAANATSAGDEFTSVSFWDRVDLIGLDGYFPLTNQAGPSLAQLVAAWRRNSQRLDIVAAIKNVADAYGKPVIFTELGYRSSSGTNIEPWNFSRTAQYDPVEQRNCIDAAFTAWAPHSSWMKGFFWWAWPVPAPSATDQDYNPRGKPAAEVLRAWQSRPDPRNAVTNTANYGPDSVAPGAIVSLWGAGLATSTVVATATPLPTKLGETTVTFNGIPAPLYFVSEGQVNAQVPFEVAPGTAIAEVLTGSKIALTQLTVRSAGPGIFTTNGQGTGAGAILDALTFALVTASEPVAAGRYVAIYCTGLGAARADGSTEAPVEVWIDRQRVPVQAAVLAPGFVGLYQVNALVPAGLAAGSHELRIVVGDASSNVVTLSTR